MEKSIKNNGGLFEIIKGLIIAIVVSLLLVLVGALIVKYCNIDSYISVVNQIIKSLSIFIGIIISFSKRPNGWLRGLVFGMIFVVLSFVIYSSLNMSFEFDIKLLNDFVFGGITGLVSGILAVNIKKAK